MSKGTRVHHQSSRGELDKLIGTRVLQVAVPSNRRMGFELHNYDNTLTSLDLVKGEKLKASFEGVNDPLIFESAVFTYEEVGMNAIAEFGKAKDED